MAFLMLAILIILLCVSYFAGKRNLLSPWFLLCLAVFLPYIIILCNWENWNVQISGIFVLYVTTALLAFGCGMLIITKLFRKTTAKYPENSVVTVKKSELYGTNPSRKRYPTNSLLLISLVCTVLYVLKLVMDVGLSSSLSTMLRNIYNNVVNNNYSPGFVFNQMREIITAIAYISLFRFLQELFSNKPYKTFIRLAVPILLFIVLAIMSSDRNIFLRFAIYAICMYVVFFQHKSKNMRYANKQIVFRVIILLMIVVVIFFLMGKAKQYSSDFTRAISIYGGSGLYNFNLWLQKFDGELYYGASTFSTFINLLNTLLSPFGAQIQGVADIARFDEMIIFTSPNGYVYVSNIYSAMYPYVQDFGYFGVIIFPFAIGAFYGFLFERAKKRNNAFSWLIYCLLIYPIVFFAIAEQLIRRFHLGFVYEIVWCAIIYYFACGRGRISKKRIVSLPKGECCKCKE
ncbi:MAG: oligosaccharide repeat unit polymerase [Clostridiales bacterium]|nr:oligosaccharide repeat unit polymerase [Clostridiales bacterium]